MTLFLHGAPSWPRTAEAAGRPRDQRGRGRGCCRRGHQRPAQITAGHGVPRLDINAVSGGRHADLLGALKLIVEAMARGERSLRCRLRYLLGTRAGGKGSRCWRRPAGCRPRDRGCADQVPELARGRRPEASASPKPLQATAGHRDGRACTGDRARHAGAGDDGLIDELSLPRAATPAPHHGLGAQAQGQPRASSSRTCRRSGARAHPMA